MQIREYVTIAFRSIIHRRLRSWLTVLGIVIGIAAITSLLTISQSLSNSIEEQFESFGANLVFVAASNFQGPGSFGTGNFITEDDVDVLKSMPEFKEVSTTRFTSETVEFHNKEVYASIVSFDLSDESLLDDLGIELEAGRWLEKGETGAAVIGYMVAHDVFDEDIHVKNRIVIEGKRFTVVGIMEEIGNSGDDMQIYVSDDEVVELAGKDEIMSINAFVRSGLDVAVVAEKAQQKLDRARNDEDLTAWTAKDILEQINKVLGIINFVLVGVAAISLLVGSVGIMNTMYTAVLERTKEIGIMKAIGAGNNEIMMIFLIESGFFGILGGAIGAFLGTLLAKSVEAVSAAFPFQFTVTPNVPIIIGSIIFSAVIGAAAGAFPAYRASKLKPTDALRYE